MSTIPGLEVTHIDPEVIEPTALVNLEQIYQDKIARCQSHGELDPCAVCEEYERILDALLKQ